MTAEKIVSSLEKYQEKIESFELEGDNQSEFHSIKADVLLLLEEMTELAQNTAEEPDAEPVPPEHEE